MGLPGRETLTERLDQLIDAWSSASGRWTPAAGGTPHLTEPSPPAVYVIGVDGFDSLDARGPDASGDAMRELTRRLDRLVRSSDVLGRLAPDRFALAVAAVAPSAAGVIMERIAGAVAMPLDVGDDAWSLSVTIGVSFGIDGVRAAEMLRTAELDLERPRSN